MKTKKNTFLVLLSLAMLTTYGQQVKRAQKLFVKHGLQYQTWTFSGAHEWPNDTGQWQKDSYSTKAYNSNSVRYVRIQLPGDSNEILSLAEVEVFSGGVNVALNKTATQSSDGGGAASRAVDGNTSGVWTDGSVTHTTSSSQPWWQVDLGANYNIDYVKVWNRTDCCRSRLRGYHILASPNAFTSSTLSGAVAETGVILIGPHFPIGNEYTNLPFVQDFYEKPMYNYAFFKDQPNAKWGLEKAPYGEHLNVGPTSNEIANGFLSTNQTSKVSNLVTLGFGDEESYSSNVLTWTTNWFALSRTHYPNALLHNNQFVGQWSDAQMRTYIQTAQPDFISFDNYLFSEGQTDFGGGSLRPMYDYLGRYRRLALEGLDGNGASPIEFGQYTIGFRQGAGQASEGGKYYTSESQIYGEVFGSLTMGAKWLSAWRYTRGDKSYWIDDAGNLLAGYYWYAKALREFNNLSPHLSRLHTKDIRFIPGEHLSAGSTVTNTKPNEINLWAASADPYITNITATNLVSGTNNGLKGDVVVGYFEPVENLSTDSELTMAPIHNKNAKYFMLMNGLTKANGCCHTSIEPQFAQDTIQGLANLATQKISLSIDFKSNPVDILKRVNRSTGNVEIVPLTQVSGSQYSVDITLDGGKADLFYWENAHLISNSTSVNLALNKLASQSSTSGSFTADKSVDGNTSGVLWPDGQGSHTNQESQPWWQVDLGAVANITEVKVYNRTDCCADRLTNYHIFVSDVPFTSNTVSGTQAQSGIGDFHEAGQAGTPTTRAVNRTGRYVRIQLENTNGILNMGEVEVYGTYTSNPTNLALNKSASQSSTSGSFTADKSVDGNTSGVLWPDGQGSHTNQESQPWWQVDLGSISNITEVKVYNRTDCCADRLTNYHIFVSDVPFTSNTVSGTQAQSGMGDFHETGQAGTPTTRAVNRTGRYVRIQLENTNGILNMGEVEVFGYISGGSQKISNLKNSSAQSDQINIDNDLGELTIYPNPIRSGSVLKVSGIHSKFDINEKVELSVYNLSGQRLFAKQMTLTKDIDYLEVDTKGLNAGVYLLTVEGKMSNTVKKIVVE